MNERMRVMLFKLNPSRLCSAIFVPVWLCCWLSAWNAPAAERSGTSPARDFTFFVLSDVHVGARHGTNPPPATLEGMMESALIQPRLVRNAVGQPYPKEPAISGLKLGVVAMPRGLFVLGDLTDGSKDPAVIQMQWAGFQRMYPVLDFKIDGTRMPVFACEGNHDGAPEDATRQGLLERNRELLQAGKLDAVSSNGVHTAWNWDGVHFISLGLCAADTTDSETPFKFGRPGPGSWADPQGAFTFLRDYLVRQVGKSGQPVVLMSHYGFDPFSENDWNWWTLKQRRALYELLQNYNVLAILHGHDHATAHYVWPDLKSHAADLNFFFDGKVPAHVRQYDVFSCGPECWVMRIRDNQFIAAHWTKSGWSTRPDDYFVKTTKP